VSGSRIHAPEGEIIMKFGNIGKGIAFASLWYYAATIYPSLEEIVHLLFCKIDLSRLK